MVSDLVPLEEEAVLAWLLAQGFDAIKKGELRRPIQHAYRMMTPFERACECGQLNVCKWLYHHGAAADVAKANNSGETPMHWACFNGHLSVCEWLFEAGAAADVTKSNFRGGTPMLLTCREGHLPVCRWLRKRGADARTANLSGCTPMLWACAFGHQSVCEWLFEEAGAADDIARADNDGDTPLLYACANGHLSICRWLVMKGALSPGGGGGGGAVSDGGDGELAAADGATDGENSTVTMVAPLHEAVDRATRPSSFGADHRPALLAWAQGILDTHHTFLHVVLRATVVFTVPANGDDDGSHQPCYLPRLPRVVLERLATMLGVEMGQRLRRTRQFAEALVALGTGPALLPLT